MMVTLKRSVAGLALGATAFAGGALVGGPMVGFAQEDPPAQEDDEVRPPDGGPCARARGRHLEAAAEAIGIEVDALREALRNGQSMAQVAEANGVEVQAVVDALVADANEHLDEAVANGRLTQEEADEKKANLNERITALVNGELRMGDRPGPDEGNNHPEEEQTAITSS